MNKRLSILVLGSLATVALLGSPKEAKACSGAECYAATSGDVLQGEYTGTTGNGNGVKGTNASGGATAAGVKGENTGGPGYGVIGISDEGGTGVYGSGNPSLGGGDAYGVVGVLNSSAGGGYAIEGNANGGGGWAGYFTGGSVNVTSGDSYYYNGATCVGGSCSSDQRLKQNIQPLSGALDQLLQLKGVTYEWRNPDNHGHPTGTQTGFIAQEVEKVFPAWVDDHADGFKGITLPPMQLAAMQVESIRALKAENDKLKLQLASLDDRLKVLESGRHPVATGIGVGGGAGLGMFGLALGAVLVSRRRKEKLG